METGIHWEVTPALNKNELLLLEEFVDSINKIIQKFEFFANAEIADPNGLNIVIIDDSQMKIMNSNYRKKNKATDVLTFAFEKTKSTENEPNFAEIYISQDTAKKQSEDHNLTLLNEFIILIVHGLLHAFNYDHERSKESSIEMRSYEKRILAHIGAGSIDPLTR